MKAYRDRIAAARNIVIIGGGAVGIEMAGEIASSFKGSKKVTLVHAQNKLINATYNDKFRDGLKKQLIDLGVTLHLGDRIEGEYDFASGPVDLKTREGHSIDGVDLVIPAIGGSINSALLRNLVPQAISSNGVKVKPTFQLEGHDDIFVIGDLADLPEQKQAAKATGHAAVVNTNITTLINGNGKPLADYKAPKEMIMVNIGPNGGLGYLVRLRALSDSGIDMLMDTLRSCLSLEKQHSRHSWPKTSRARLCSCLKPVPLLDTRIALRRLHHPLLPFYISANKMHAFILSLLTQRKS